MKSVKAVVVFLGAIAGAIVVWYYHNDPESIAFGALVGGFITNLLVDWATE